jgi:hypothetical protein
LTDYRFYTRQTRYLQATGRILPRVLGKIFRKNGFNVWVNPRQGNGVDLKLFDAEGRLVLVVEVLNWSFVCKFSNERKQSIINNLTGYNCNRILVYTAMRNEHLLQDLPQHGISTLKIGYQLLTPKSYEFFLAKHQVIKRRINDRCVKREIEQKVLQYIEASKIHP